MKHILFTLKGCPYGLLDDEHIVVMYLDLSDVGNRLFSQVGSVI